MYNDIIQFIKRVKTDRKDEYGDAVYEESRRTVFAEVVSVGQSEFFQAMTIGIKPEIKFKIADYYDYQNEEELVYGDYIYKILRTYRNGVELEVTCYGGVRLERS